MIQASYGYEKHLCLLVYNSGLGFIMFRQLHKFSVCLHISIFYYSARFHKHPDGLSLLRLANHIQNLYIQARNSIPLISK